MAADSRLHEFYRKYDVTLGPVPAYCTEDDADVEMGIDEAGRGSVMGPMVYGCAFWGDTDARRMSRMGFDDSKALSELQRERMFKDLGVCESSGYITFSIKASTISAAMQRDPPTSLNVISHDAAMDLIRMVLALNVKLRKVYVDTVGDAAAYQRKLQREFPTLRFVVSPGADAMYTTVSAASIAAKVIRDRALRDWKFTEPKLQAVVKAMGDKPVEGLSKKKMGIRELRRIEDGDREQARAEEEGEAVEESKPAKRSRKTAHVVATSCELESECLHPYHASSGYPSDPLTKQWLTEHFDPVFGWADVVRFSWANAKKLLESGVSVEWPEPGASPVEHTADQSRLTSMFSASKKKRTFTEKRRIASVTSFE